MDRIAMSPAASALLRCLTGRARVPRDRILLSDIYSVDWRSLTFSGERHELQLRIPGPDSRVVRLFDPRAMPTPPTPGQIQSRIADHLGDGAPRSAPSKTPPSDASQALSAALAELRRSLR